MIAMKTLIVQRTSACIMGDFILFDRISMALSDREASQDDLHDNSDPTFGLNSCLVTGTHSSRPSGLLFHTHLLRYVYSSANYLWTNHRRF